MSIDNIVVGKPFSSLESLGIEPREHTVFVDGPLWLPSLLVKLGLFKSTSEISRINKQRKHLIAKDSNLDLWRLLKKPELTEFKVGKRYFWLLVGDLSVDSEHQ